MAGSIETAQRVPDDLIAEFRSVGLHLNPAKIKWTMNKHVLPGPLTQLIVDGVCIHPPNSFVCLGSVVTANLYDTLAIEHRIDTAWARFHKWSCPLQKPTVFLVLCCPPLPFVGLGNHQGPNTHACIQTFSFLST